MKVFVGTYGDSIKKNEFLRVKSSIIRFWGKWKKEKIAFSLCFVDMNFLISKHSDDMRKSNVYFHNYLTKKYYNDLGVPSPDSEKIWK